MEITQLIERCKQGDSVALGELYQTYASKMKGMCRRYLSDKEAINDVLHDSFVIILTSLDKLRDDSKAEGWMMSITRNVASKYKDYQKKHQTVAFDKTERTFFDDDVQDKDFKEISMSELMSLIDKLPEGYGKVFRLAVFEGLSHKEIATMLNIEPHSSSSQLARAKRLLRKMIQQSWIVLLLLLIIPVIFLIRREKTIGNDETPVVVQNEKTQTPQPTEQSQSPTIVVQQPTQKPTITADTQQSADNYLNKPIILDTMPTVVAQEVITADTSHNEQLSDTIQSVRKIETPYYDLADIHKDGVVEPMRISSPLWSLEFAYAGSFDEQNFTSLVTNTPDIDEGGGKSLLPDVNASDTVQYTNYHYMPVTLTLMAHYRQSKHLGVEAGLSYIRLVSDFETKKDSTVNREPLQTIHYVGIPVKGIYHIYNAKGWNLYGNLGFAMNIPVRSQFNEKGLLHDGKESISRTYSHIPLLWSVSTGFGLQYNLTPNIGIFAEPSVLYYIPTRSGLETYCTEHPFTFSLPVGIRFIW